MLHLHQLCKIFPYELVIRAAKEFGGHVISYENLSVQEHERDHGMDYQSGACVYIEKKTIIALQNTTLE